MSEGVPLCRIFRNLLEWEYRRFHFTSGAELSHGLIPHLEQNIQSSAGSSSAFGFAARITRAAGTHSDLLLSLIW